ncbi:MAG TPA: pyruvate, phosphate dikinase, partial [Candidatus Hydrogenedentes bacterium]|nr:pyruvate, phosphate dikinase [Candidatus Hydrogenedentota bacterium]
MKTMDDTRKPGHGVPLEQVAGGTAVGALVWQVDAQSDYEPFAAMFAAGARDRSQRLIYFRFGDGPMLTTTDAMTEVVLAHPQEGFEPFISEMLKTIHEHGNSAAYLFDCISPLAADWFSDQMVGNFFVIICATLGGFRGTACFAILRNLHSQYAMDPVTNTAQGLLDVCRHENRLYVQPLKMEYESLSCPHVLHVCKNGHFESVRDSHTAAVALTAGRRDNLGLARHHLGVWSRTFVEAEALLDAQKQRGVCTEKTRAMCDRILRMAVTRDPRVLRLVQRYFSLEDLVFLGTRMLGTGLIGGKAADMLLARAALLLRDPLWRDLLESHDSFFIPSDVFYTFLV